MCYPPRINSAQIPSLVITYNTQSSISNIYLSFLCSLRVDVHVFVSLSWCVGLIRTFPGKAGLMGNLMAFCKDISKTTNFVAIYLDVAK